MKRSVRFCLEDKLEFQRAPYYRLLSFEEESNEELVKFTNDTKSIHLSSDESEESSRCSFSALSDEIILKIFENLDWRSLCSVSRVDKRLNRIAQDPHLYTYLNINGTSCTNLHHRCKYLRRLSLSRFYIESSDILKFLIPCGRHLTHLQLHDCDCINDSTLPQIVDICQNLKVLSLAERNLTDKGVLCLENLQFLECLTLIHDISIYIKSETLYKILRRNRRIHRLCIIINPEYMNADDVAVELRNLCPDLESIRLLDNPTLTLRGINALADCKNLREVDFTMCGNSSNYGDCFHKLFSSCQRLERITLKYFRGLTDYNLEALILCKNLKYLNLRGVSPTTATCLKILLNCPKLFLESFLLSYDADKWDKTRNLLNQWKQKYSLHDHANYRRYS